MAPPNRVALISSGSSAVAVEQIEPVDWSSSPAWHRKPLVDVTSEDFIAFEEEVDEKPTRPKRGRPPGSKNRTNRQPEFIEDDGNSLFDDQMNRFKRARAGMNEKQPLTAQELAQELKNSIVEYDTSIGYADSKAEPAEPQQFTPIFLSPEQKKVLEMVVDHRMSVFFTGAAGTGKSVLLRRIISDLRKRWGNRVAVTASTGIAACNIGGSTVHSFAGIGLGEESVENLVKKIKRNKKTLARWKNTQVLIVDEISMINASLLDKLDAIASKLRKDDRPFGGIQLILTGDFFQLPPIEKNRDRESTQRTYAFLADCWSEIVDKTILLTQVFRQKDPTFAQMLNEMRQGQLNEKTIATFKSLDRPPEMPEGIVPTRLYPRREEVDRANTQALGQINGQSYDFVAEDSFDPQLLPAERDRINLNNLIAPEKVSLKVGAQVMMIKNIDESLVNGSLGRVIGFMSDEVYSFIPESLKEKILDNGTVHSSPPELFGEDFENRLMGIRGTKDLQKLEDAIERRKRMRLDSLQDMAANSRKYLPLIRFYGPDGTFRDILVQPEAWTIEDSEGRPLARRQQIPLILAWALSIHKSQGQTLDWVTVDLGNVFEVGQAYVAISRATSLDGLQIRNFEPRRVFVDSGVLDFYHSLEDLNGEETAKARQSTLFEFARKPEQNDYEEEVDLPQPAEYATSPYFQKEEAAPDATYPMEDIEMSPIVDQKHLHDTFPNELTRFNETTQPMFGPLDMSPEDFDHSGYNFMQPSRRFMR